MIQTSDSLFFALCGIAQIIVTPDAKASLLAPHSGKKFGDACRVNFSDAIDRAARDPGKLKQMQALFQAVTRKNNVLPLDECFAKRANVPDRPSHTRGRTSFT
jgi:hypothetical protein